MGSCFSQEEDDDNEIKFIELENVDAIDDEVEEPRRRKKRHRTDIFFLFLMATFLAVFAGLILYCATISDVNRIIHGYDNCGNVCGDNNEKGRYEYDSNNIFGCTRKNMQNKPYLSNGECVKNCDAKGYITLIYRCNDIADNFGDIEHNTVWHMLSQDLSAASSDLIHIILIAFGLIGVIILLLRYFIGVFVWFLLIGGSFGAILLSVCLWISYLSSANDNVNNSQIFLVVTIVVSILTFIIVMLVIVLRKRIKLIIQLFKEASKALGAIPHLLLQPVVTFAAFLISFLVFSYCVILCLSAGNLSHVGYRHYTYIPNELVIATEYLLTVTCYWLTFFYLGCQDMIVGGTIASWYFSRDKSRLNSPIWRSTVNLVKYHLGTVALGSLIMLIMQFVKKIFNFLRKRLRHACCCCCCLCFGLSCVFKCFEEFIKYFTKLAYIMTAMHGVPFCKGGQYAIQLFAKNGSAVLRLNSIGSFILFLVKLLIVAVTVIISTAIFGPKLEELHNPGALIALSAAIAYFLATCFLSVYSTAIETIFLCFCEDSDLNDGVTRPYYMSKEMMLFVENSNKTLDYIESNFYATPAARTEYNGIRVQEELSSNA